MSGMPAEDESISSAPLYLYNNNRQPCFAPEELAWDGRPHKGDDLVLPGQRQAISAPEEPYRGPPLPGDLLCAPEGQQLRLAQMIHRDQVCMHALKVHTTTQGCPAASCSQAGGTLQDAWPEAYCSRRRVAALGRGW